jgi:betaine reductase
VIVLLGTPTAESSRLYGLTVRAGDPAWAGPLAGRAVGLPVFHITEPGVKAQIPPDIYEAQVGMAELVMDVTAIGRAMAAVRDGEA